MWTFAEHMKRTMAMKSYPQNLCMLAAFAWQLGIQLLWKSYCRWKLDFRLRAFFCWLNQKASEESLLKTALEKAKAASLVFEARTRRLENWFSNDFERDTESCTYLTRATFAVSLLSSRCKTIAEDWKTSESFDCQKLSWKHDHQCNRTRHLDSEDQRLSSKFEALKYWFVVASPAGVHVSAGLCSRKAPKIENCKNYGCSYADASRPSKLKS